VARRSTTSTGYARVQVAGVIAAAASFTTSSTTITMGTANPGWIVASMNATAGANIGTVASYTSTTLTLTAAAAHACSGTTDSLVFSAWPAAAASSGTEPSVTPASATNTDATISFAQATASWGTVVAWGIYDAATANPPGIFRGKCYISVAACTVANETRSLAAGLGLLPSLSAGTAPPRATRFQYINPFAFTSILLLCRFRCRRIDSGRKPSRYRASITLNHVHGCLEIF
jgi:hypothetical protein